MSSESTRRVAHAAGSTIAAVVQWFLSFPELTVLAVMFVAVLGATRLTGHLQSVHGVSRTTAGAQLLPIGLLLAVAASWGHRPAAAFGILVLGFGDPLAAVFGRRGGLSWRVPGGHKTLIGSAAFFTTALLLGGIFAAADGTLALLACIGAAAVLTAIEGASGFGLDNVLVPVAGAFAGRAWLGL